MRLLQHMLTGILLAILAVPVVLGWCVVKLGWDIIPALRATTAQRARPRGGEPIAESQPPGAYVHPRITLVASRPSAHLRVRD